MRIARVILVALLWGAIAGAADLISLDVLPCGKPGEAGGLGAGTELERYTIDTRRYPDAVCNDGSPAVYYVRPYSGEENRDKWLIMLQGGGTCRTGQACAERWCSIDTNFGMDKMTTTISKPFIRGGGMLTPDAQNQFGNWNTVLVYYCSSDGWAGRRSDVEYSATNGTATVQFRMHFRGGDIVDAVFDRLRHPARSRPARIGNPPVFLPDIDEATQVLFAGSSGGGSGVHANADRISELLRANNVRCRGNDCPLDYRALIDSHFFPDRKSLNFANTIYCLANAELCSYEGHIRNLEFVIAQERNELADASCLSYHQSVEPGTEWKCADSGHVIRNHITTPLFIGQDEQDDQLSENFTEQGFGTLSDFGNKVEAELHALATLDARAEEGSALSGAPLTRPGSWGPQCRGHELLGNNEDFFRTIVPAGGSGVSYHDVVWNWWSGSAPTEAVRDFTTPGAVQGCP